jgi:hypothetical protein
MGVAWPIGHKVMAGWAPKRFARAATLLHSKYMFKNANNKQSTGIG